MLILSYSRGDLIIFGGGMPRASYGDRNTVTAMQGEFHVTFNLTSRVIDFVVVDDDESGEFVSLLITFLYTHAH